MIYQQWIKSLKLNWVAGLGLLGLMAFSIFLRAPFFSVPMISDDGGYAYVAHFWSGDSQLYRDIPYDRPQAIFLIYKLCLFIFGGSVEAIRLAAALYNALTVAALFFFACQVFSQRAAWLGALIFATFSASPRIEGFTANAELFTLLPLVVAAHLTWKEKWLAAGLVSGIAFLIKPAALSGLLLTLVWTLVVKASWRAPLACLLGFSSGPLVSMAHGYWVGWEFYWSSLVERRVLLFSLFSLDITEQLNSFFLRTKETVSAWIVPAALAGAALPHCPNRTRGFALLWLAASLVGMSLGGRWYWHYYLQLIPPLAFLAAATLSRPLLSSRVVWGGVVSVAVIISLVGQLPFWLLTPKEVSWELYHRPGYLVNSQIAEYVASRTGQEDLIYVAFEGPEIYYLAGRRNAAPQLFWNEVHFSSSIFDQVADAIRRGLPDRIVWIQLPPDWITLVEFRDLLTQGYVEEFRLEGIGIYRRRDTD